MVQTVGDAIIAMILGIPGALLMFVLRWAGFVDMGAVFTGWMVSGAILYMLLYPE
jgi:hypothetical protein